MVVIQKIGSKDGKMELTLKPVSRLVSDVLQNAVDATWGCSDNGVLYLTLNDCRLVFGTTTTVDELREKYLACIYRREKLGRG